MKLNQTNVGELYAALSPIEIKQLSAYLDEKPNDKVKKLHQWMVKLTKENKLKDCDTDFLIQKILGKNTIYSSYTTVVNLLINHIKDYLILSKVREKNIYTETLWGEILIERRLKRNLLLKITNFKLDLYKDSYALMKKFYNSREVFFYNYLTLTKKNFEILISSQKEHVDSFNDYINYYQIELYNGLISIVKNKKQYLSQMADFLFSLYKIYEKTQNDILKIQALSLRLASEQTSESYSDLKSFFIEKYNLWSIDTCVQMIPIIYSFGQNQVNKGDEIFNKKNHDFLDFLHNEKLLFKQGIFSMVLIINYIRLELRYGTIEKAEQLLEESLKVIAPAQKDSFQYLIESRISFAKKDYKISLRKISTINPSDSIYYFPQYKIMLIKNYIMLADIDRLMAERENFYKYLNNQKNIQEDEKRRHKLFIKYTEYLTNARYEYLTDYMKKRIENALLQTSPYFSEKQWVRERWEELRILNS